MRKNNFNADITDNMLEMGDFSQIMVIALRGASSDDQQFVVDYVLRHRGELSQLDKEECIRVALDRKEDDGIWEGLVDGLSG